MMNLVLNNSDHIFSSTVNALSADANQPKVVATPGTDAAVLGQERSQLESGALTASGRGINAEYSA
jgi:hypothetical protein